MVFKHDDASPRDRSAPLENAPKWFTDLSEYGYWTWICQVEGFRAVMPQGAILHCEQVHGWPIHGHP